MGAIAESMVAYAQPLLDETDGSMDQMNNAFAMAQICWNLALLPEKDREDSLTGMQPELKMNNADFENFQRSTLLPMIQRHHEMFPNMPLLDPESPTTLSREKKYPGTGRNALCPCNSGKKYKRCCGQ